MRQERTGKPDPERARATEAAEQGQKRGFFAAAGARLKRVMTGRAEPEPSVAPAPAVVSETAEEEGAEVSTSVQARARELLLQDRAHGAGHVRANAEAATLLGADEEPAQRSSPPPLPLQRTAAAAEADAIEQPATGIKPIPPRRAARAAAKRPVRDSKSDALRARLGAAKAAFAEAQAKRAAESGVTALPSSELTQLQPAAAEEPDKPAPEITVEEADLIELQLEASEELLELQPLAAEIEAQPLAAAADQAAAESGKPNSAATEAEASPPAAANSGDSDAAEPIRTLTIARLLASQGYFERSLSIYDELLATSTDDLELSAEADRVRAKIRTPKNAD